MIPETIDRYLKQHHLAYEHMTHLRAVAAQRLAAAEHVAGARIAKPVVVDLDVLRRATGATRAELVPEQSFQNRFEPCEAGAEPAIGLFGLPMFVDDEVARQPWIVRRGGTHADAIRIDTAAWLREEHVKPVERLGIHRL